MNAEDVSDREWEAALVFRKEVEDVFYVLELAGQHGDKNDALKAEALLRRAGMHFDEVVSRRRWFTERP